MIKILQIRSVMDYEVQDKKLQIAFEIPLRIIHEKKDIDSDAFAMEIGKHLIAAIKEQQ